MTHPASMASLSFAGFAASLLDPSQPIPAGLQAWNSSDPQVRLDVHRNTVVTAWVDALAESLPVVQMLVGEAFFRTMALHLTRLHPPRSACLWRHALDLPDAIARYVPAASLPYLADVARLEVALLASGHALDAASVTADDLARAALRPDQLTGLGLHLHPAVRVVRSAHPIVSLWAAHQGDGDTATALSGIDMNDPQSALVIRGDDGPVVVRIADGTAIWLQALADGHRLSAAVQQAVASAGAEPFDLATSWALTLARGCFTHWTLETP